ncbi:MAG: TrpB-like pyridoxal phosphate-dependent enzyme [Candidatus Altiarchaeota archaeon]|nr:TrpB-like pyridoxal phosphate-dependent enzyme [Candidatus Altiarchaeota archaeon]
MDDKTTKILLDEEEMPKSWYNINPDLPKPLPAPLNPATHEPLGPADLAPLFPMELIKQEMSMERYIKIPDEVWDIYRIWRPSPLYRARRLEKALKTKAKIFYKWEGVSPPGSHKPNTAIAQAYYNMKEGTERLTTETGAGQWGSSLAFATQLFGLECTVYMVKVSYEQKPYRRILMETWGAEVFPSPTIKTNSGRKILEKDPDSPGSLGIAISEAVEDAVGHDDTKYSLGSVLNHVLLHQSIVGLEAKKQLESVDLYPDVVMGCFGGGSNFSGMAFPFIHDKLKGDKKELRAIACEPAACPKLTRGVYAYDFGDTAELTPLVKMYTLGHTFIPEPIHAGGLRYHGGAPQYCLLENEKVVEARSFHQTECFKAAELFAKTEGFIIAPETAHVVQGVIEEAKGCTGKKVILFNCSGHGHFDLASYDAFHAGRLKDYDYPEAKIKEALTHLPNI